MQLENICITNTDVQNTQIMQIKFKIELHWAARTRHTHTHTRTHTFEKLFKSEADTNTQGKMQERHAPNKAIETRKMRSATHKIWHCSVKRLAHWYICQLIGKKHAQCNTGGHKHAALCANSQVRTRWLRTFTHNVIHTQFEVHLIGVNLNCVILLTVDPYHMKLFNNRRYFTF